MDLGGSEWGHFCQDILLVEGGVLQTQADLVVLVDGLLNGVVCALTGCGEYADRVGSSGTWLMCFVGQHYVLLVLCGRMGVFPFSYGYCDALGIHGGAGNCNEDDAACEVSREVCSWAY